MLPFLLYVATGACAGLAAMIIAVRLDAAPPTLGEGLEIDVLSAVLLGGVAFGGGKGSMVGVAAGVLFIGFLNNGLLLMGAPPFWLRVSSGLALVAAAALEGTSRYLERRRRGGRVERAMSPSPTHVAVPIQDVIEKELRERILLGLIEPGARINVRQLEQHFGVSHIPIREAIRRLEAEGLVVNVPKRGAVAAGVSLKEFDDIYDLRRIVEPQVVERVGRRDDRGRSRQPHGHAYEALIAAEQGRPTVEFSTAHWDFHWACARPGLDRRDRAAAAPAVARGRPLRAADTGASPSTSPTTSTTSSTTPASRVTDAAAPRRSSSGTSTSPATPCAASCTAGIGVTTMRAAVVTAIGSVRRRSSSASRPRALRRTATVVLDGASPSRSTRSTSPSASGRFYAGHPPLPYVPGVECVGRIAGG